MTKAWRRVGRRLDGRRVEGLLRRRTFAATMPVP